jgi:hypothetical protein
MSERSTRRRAARVVLGACLAAAVLAACRSEPAATGAPPAAPASPAAPPTPSTSQQLTASPASTPPATSTAPAEAQTASATSADAGSSALAGPASQTPPATSTPSESAEASQPDLAAAREAALSRETSTQTSTDTAPASAPESAVPATPASAASTPPCPPPVARVHHAHRRKKKELPQGPEPPEPPAPRPADAVVDAQVGQVAAPLTSILGKDVKSPTGEDMGRVVDVLADAEGHVRVAIIDFGGFLGVGNRRIAVDWPLLHFNPDAANKWLVLSVTRQKLQSTPEYKDPNSPRVLMPPPAPPDASPATQARK